MVTIRLYSLHVWLGKTCLLFDDSIEIAGISYNLTDLTSIHPTYRMVLGVPSLAWS